MRAQYTEQLLSRAERDPEFRERLTEDPNSAIAEELGVEVPENVKVRVVQEGPDEAILVLPRHLEPGQLRDEELAAAAGGTGSYCAGCTDQACPTTNTCQ
jgi:hypothetical protein